MNTFIKTLLILLLVYFGIRFSYQLLKPYIMRYLAKKLSERFEKQFGGTPFNTANTAQEPGKVTIDKNPQKKQRSTNTTVGEYIDFEELD